jgi:SNF2-related domain
MADMHEGIKFPKPVWNKPDDPMLGSQSSIEKAPDDWITIGSLVSETGSGRSTIKPILEKFIQENGEQHVKYSKVKIMRDGKSLEGPFQLHYSPAAIAYVRKSLDDMTQPPHGWETNSAVARQFNLGGATTQRLFDEYIKLHGIQTARPYRIRRYMAGGKLLIGGLKTHYSPAAITYVKEELSKTILPPKGWQNTNQITESLGVPRITVEKLLNKFIETMGDHNRGIFKYGGGGDKIFYSPEATPFVMTELETYPPSAISGWKTVGAVAKKMHAGDKLVEKLLATFVESHGMQHARQFRSTYIRKGKLASGGVGNHFSPEAVAFVEGILMGGAHPPEGWMTAGGVAANIAHSSATVKKYLDEFVKHNGAEHGKVFRVRHLHNNKEIKGKPMIHYSPEAVEYAREMVGNLAMPPEGWKTNWTISGEVNRAQTVTRPILEEFVRKQGTNHKKFFKTRSVKLGKEVFGRVAEHFSPEAIAHLLKELNSRGLEIAGRSHSNEDLNKTMTFLDVKSPEGKIFQEIVFALGPEAARDLLHAFVPGLSDLPVQDVNGRLARYLGEYRPPRPYPIGPALDKLVPILDNVNIQQLLFASIKRECQRNYFSVRKAGEEPNAQPVREYFAQLRSQISQPISNDSSLGKVLQQAENYFVNEVLGEVVLPDQVVPQLREGRPFPDIYQRINMSEIRNHQRFLIADEMGVGKSASAILAKESMGMKCALVVLPAGVAETWERYLSDNVEDGKQIGYFKPGQKPNVLVVTSENIGRLEIESFDYVVISREKLNDTYSDALRKLQFDMLVVDEVHEHKKGEKGVWSKTLLDLAQKIDTPEKRMVLLSGTPVPNKVKDVAMLIKLLHPEMQKESIGSLTQSILKGDLLASRANLLPLMQMKSLADHVEMPNLTIENINVELSPQEESVFKDLLDRDDLQPQEKMWRLRKFLLNQRSVIDVPDLESSKIKALKGELTESLKTKRKIVVFVNPPIDSIIRGKQDIFDELGLSAGINKYVIHGEDPVGSAKRKEQREGFQNDNQPAVLFLSGETENVGVDYSYADHVVFYNEPWTYADFRQQLSRIYRPGLKNELSCKVLVTKGTIEEGISNYIKFKHDAIEKLLRGVPLTREEQEKLEKQEESEKPEDIAVNPELADYYRSRYDEVMRMFGHTKGRGEKDFFAALSDGGKGYAEIYEMFGGRSYQDNGARVCSNLIKAMAREQGRDVSAIDVLDMGSGPAMLYRRSTSNVQRNTVSLDLNRMHFEGKKLGMTVVGGFADNPFPNSKHFDYLNLSFAIQDTAYEPETGEYERIHAFAESARMLRLNGRLLVNMMYTTDFRDEAALAKALEKFGLKTVPEYTGEVDGGIHYKARVLVFEKVRDVPEAVADVIATFSPQDFRGLRLLNKYPQLVKTRARKRPTQRDRLISEFKLNEKTIPIEYNDEDAKIKAEEERIIAEVEEMKDRYRTAEGRGVLNVDRNELIEKGYGRDTYGKVFKKVHNGGLIFLD